MVDVVVELMLRGYAVIRLERHPEMKHASRAAHLQRGVRSDGGTASGEHRRQSGAYRHSVSLHPPQLNTDDAELDGTYPRRLLVTIIMAIIVFTSSMTLVSAALPTLAAAFDSTESFLSWSVTGLFLAMAVGTPILGRLGDLQGHRRWFLIGAATLSVGTLLCALAPTATAFVAARFVVGLGIAATIPNSMALLMAAYPIERRSEAMGWFTMAMTGAPVLGLVIGGPLIEFAGWRSVFVVLTPISVIGFTMAWRVIRCEDPDRVGHGGLDWSGAVTLAIATIALLLFMERGGSAGFADSVAVGLAAVAVIGLAVFIAIERASSDPMLKLGYFARRNFTGPLIANPLSNFAYMGGFVISPLLLDQLFGYSVAIVALVLLFRPGLFSISSPIGGRLARSTGERPLLIIGTVLMVASMATWVLGALWVNLGLVIVGLLLSGLAMGLASPSYATVIASSVPVEDLGVANGMSATMMNIGMLTGIQTMFTVLGDGREPADFARTFAVGGAVAAIGIVGALMVRSTTGRDAIRRSGAGPHESSSAELSADGLSRADIR